MQRYEEAWRRNLTSVINTLTYMRDNPYKDHDSHLRWINMIWGWLPELKRSIIWFKNTQKGPPNGDGSKRA